MEMQQELADFRAQFERTAPAERVALYEAKIGELRASGVLDSALGAGDLAPDFALPGADGREIGLTEPAETGPGGRDLLPGWLVPLLQHPAPRLSARFCPRSPPLAAASSRSRRSFPTNRSRPERKTPSPSTC